MIKIDEDAYFDVMAALDHALNLCDHVGESNFQKSLKAFIEDARRTLEEGCRE